MKILHVALNDQGNRQEALSSALRTMGEYYEFDWIEEKKKGIREMRRALIETAKTFNPDVIFMQIQNGDTIDVDTVRQLPGFKINWTGDVRQPLPQWYVEIGKAISLTLFTNMADVEAATRRGVKADFLQIGFNHKVFKPEGEKVECPEIVFMGNNYDNLFPLSGFRKQMVQELKRKYGNRFGVYGNNWGSLGTGNLMYNEEGEAAIYRSCKIAINLSHFDLSRYSSDRIFRIMGSGAFCLSHNYKDIDIDFNGQLVDVWESVDELTKRIDLWLNQPEERARIAEKGCKHVHDNCTWKHQINELQNLIYEMVCAYDQ